MKEPVCCFGEGDLRPFSSLTNEQLAFCATPQPGNWEAESDDLPNYQSIYCSIAGKLLSER